MENPDKTTIPGLDHLTAKYEETAGQIDKLQDKIKTGRDHIRELEQAIAEKQQTMKTIISQIIKTNQHAH